MQRQRNSNQQQYPPLNPSQILQAFQIIINPTNSKQLIKQADRFILQCESNPQFALVLMRIFQELSANPGSINNQQQKLQNVIRRNWTTKRRANENSIEDKTKQDIKIGLLELYKQSWQHYYKQFNQIFKFLSRYQFPTNYPQLKQFVHQILRALAESPIQSFISPKQLLPYLSLIKTIYKGDASKRFQLVLYSKEGFEEHVQSTIELAVKILQKIDAVIPMLLQNNGQNQAVGQRILQCSRKIDKILLYCYQYAFSGMQRDQKLCKILNYLTNKIQVLLKVRKIQSFSNEAQLNILALVEGLSNLQGPLPIAFTSFLKYYLQTMLNLMINQNFQNERLISKVIQANSKPLTTLAYYANQLHFKQSNQFRRNGAAFAQDQKKCHEQFMSIYGGGNAISFMEKSIMELMQKYKKTQQTHLFQDSHQVDSVAQYAPSQLLLIMLKNLLIRFQQQFKPFIQKIFQHLLTNRLSSNSSPVAANMYEVILLLSKVYDYEQEADERSKSIGDLGKIFAVMEMCYQLGDFQGFSRLVRVYNIYFEKKDVYKVFQILVDIIAKPDVNHQILFQCALCIKKILSENQQQNLPIQKLGSCISNLLSLVPIYKKVPSHLWSLLQLISQILKCVSNETIISSLGCVVDNLNNIIQEKNMEEMTVNGVSDLLQNLLEYVEIQTINGANNQQMLQYLYQLCVVFIGGNIYSTKIQSPIPLYKLWLSVVKHIYASTCSQSLLQKLVNALHTLKDKVISEDPIIFLQLMEQYVLGGLIKLQGNDLLAIRNQIDADFQMKNRVTMAFYSLYFSFYLTYNVMIPQLIVNVMEIVKQLHTKISQMTNILRTFLLLVLNHHILEQGPQKIFQLLTSHFKNSYKQWFYPYIWSLEYLNNKYSNKVASMAMLKSIDLLDSTGILHERIEELIPLQKIMKAVSFQVQPISMSAAALSYMSSFRNMLQPDQKPIRNKIGFSLIKSLPRKYKKHIRSQWSQYDLRTTYYEKFAPIIGKLGWNLQTIDHKFDKITSERIAALMTRKNSQEEGN